MRFSERNGYRVVRQDLEREWISDELRNSLWSVVRHEIIEQLSNKYDDELNHIAIYGQSSSLYRFFVKLWLDFFKLPVDDIPNNGNTLFKDAGIQIVRDWFFQADWLDLLDFIEFCCDVYSPYTRTFNIYFERERSAYRFIDGQIVEINGKEEVVEIENAIKNADKFEPVKRHLRKGLELFGDKKSPDYPNSIKESISAVEALAKIIVKNDKATLGQALKEIENKHQIPASLKSAFDKLYGYTSNEGGIRHALNEDGAEVGVAEARFMIVTCSAFVNYLILKYAE